MTLTFSTTGWSFAPGDSSAPDEECFAALDIHESRRVLGPPSYAQTKQVVVKLNTEQAQALVDQLLHDYPYLKHGEEGA